MAGILLAGPAYAQSLEENRDRCTSAAPEIAIAACTAIIGSGPRAAADLAGAYNNRGVAHLNKREYDLAIQDFDQAIRLDFANAGAYNNRGVARVDEQDYDLAIQDFDRAIQFDPNYALAFNNRGVAYADKADYAHAIENYNQALRLNPNGAADFYLHNLTRQKLG